MQENVCHVNLDIRKEAIGFKNQANEIVFSLKLERIYSIHNVILLLGWSSHQFQNDELYLLHGTERKNLKIFQVGSNIQPIPQNFDISQDHYFFVLYHDDYTVEQNKLYVSFNEQIFAFDLVQDNIPPSFKDDYELFGNFFTFFLPTIEKFSLVWHELIWRLEPEYIKNLLKTIVDQKDLVLYRTIFTLLQEYDRNYACHIHFYAGMQIGGWLKSNTDDISQTIDIYLNHTCVAQKLSANMFREDLQKLHIGTAQYGFHLASYDYPDVQENFFYVTVRISATNTLVGFKFLARDAIKHEYLLTVDQINQHAISGWTIDQTNPDQIYNIKIYLNHIFLHTLKNDYPRRDLITNYLNKAGLGGFRFENPLQYLPRDQYELRFQFPDGTYADSINYQIKTKYKILQPLNLDILEQKVSILIPVYNAPAYLQKCLESLIKYTPDNIRIMIIDDASTDPSVQEIYRQYEQRSNILILYNQKNLGFTSSINKGIAFADDDHVILLNSDTVVTPRWLQSLLLTAGSRPKIATVTPLSNSAGAFSAPEINQTNNMLDDLDQDTYARSFRRHSLGLCPIVPTGNGFCMFVNRACLNEIGFFNDILFPHGYGEENDFCLRAERAGWINVIDDRTYIFHAESQSFGSAKKQALCTRGLKILFDKYPEYPTLVSIFNDDIRLILARYHARKALAECQKIISVQERILYVLPEIKGGTYWHTMDLLNEMQNVMQVFLITCDSYTLKIYEKSNNKLQLFIKHKLSVPIEPFKHFSSEYDQLVARFIFEYDIDIVHIQHITYHSFNLPIIAKKLGCKVVFTFHDYYMLNPNLNLLDDTGVFNGKDYLEQGSDYRANTWKNVNFYSSQLPVENPCYLDHWQKRSNRFLEYCDAFTTPTANVKYFLQQYFPALQTDQIKVIPHGNICKKLSRLSDIDSLTIPVKILALNAINDAKGLGILDALAEYDRKNYFEIHILGECLRPLKSTKIIQHGTYKRRDLYQLIEHIRPHVGVVFSIWNETFCYTLSELWSFGIPVFALDFATMRERMSPAKAGWLVQFTDIPDLYQQMLTKLLQKDEYQTALTSIQRWQQLYGIANSTSLMGIRYYNVYLKTVKSGRSQYIIAVIQGHHSTNKYIRILEKTFNDCKRELTYLAMSMQELIASIKLHYIDAVILYQTDLPAPFIDQFLALIEKQKIPYILDLDANIFNEPKLLAEQQIYHKELPYYTALVRQATLITVSTVYLKNILIPYNHRITIVPNRLNKQLWQKKFCARQEDGLIRALSFGTSAHLADFKMILPALQKIAEKYPDFRLTLIGVAQNDNNLQQYKWLECMSIPKEQSSYPHFILWLQSLIDLFDFALVPLEDTTVNRSRSNLKVLECSALGLPVIVSDINVYKDVQQIPNLLLAKNTERHWFNALEQKILLGRENRLQGLASREYVFRNYIFTEQNMAEYDQIITKIIMKAELQCKRPK